MVTFSRGFRMQVFLVEVNYLMFFQRSSMCLSYKFENKYQILDKILKIIKNRGQQKLFFQKISLEISFSHNELLNIIENP